jgi:hypothetical protein
MFCDACIGAVVQEQLDVAACLTSVGKSSAESDQWCCVFKVYGIWVGTSLK